MEIPFSLLRRHTAVDGMHKHRKNFCWICGWTHVPKNGLNREDSSKFGNSWRHDSNTRFYMAEKFLFIIRYWLQYYHRSIAWHWDKVDFFLNNQPDALTIQIYSFIKLYKFRASSLPIIRSFILYIRHW